ncbi:MAG: hypothetical protein WAN48_11490 [Actinomycetes bacterium]
MADSTIPGLTAVATPATGDLFEVDQAGTSKKMTLAQIIASTTGVLIAGNSGTANALAAPSITRQILTANASANSTTSIATVMTTSTLAAGTYRYRYDVIAQSATATVSLKFSVDGTGTVTKHLTRLFFPSAGVTAATGLVDQEAPAVTTGSVWAWQGTRADATVLGPQTDVDTINVDIHYVIEGILVTSTSGNLLLGHASETATSTQVMAGTMLELIRLA